MFDLIFTNNFYIACYNYSLAMMHRVRTILFFVMLFLVSGKLFSQTTNPSFQTRAPRVQGAINNFQDSIYALLKRAGFDQVPQAMYLRSFKYDKELEVWVKPSIDQTYKFLKSYKVCLASGTMGPKRVEGDYQVPEGFYYINEFNPNSAYHLSLGLNYPNASDRILSDKKRPGSAIYIHGNCVSVGCLPITDKMMEELYLLASMIREQGQQEFIPVHIFPVKYKAAKSLEYLENLYKQNPALADFNKNIRPVYDYFETKHQLPLILVNSKGDYVLN